MRHRPLSLALAALALACATSKPAPVADAPAAAPPAAQPAARPRVAPGANPFLHAVGRELQDGQGRKVVLQGVCFGNDVWANREVPPPNHHGEQDFADLSAIGVNAVRFYLSYRFFEDDGEPFQYLPDGFAWLDRSVAWARAHGVYLILNVHVPPGGFQSNGGGGALWRVPGNQDRFVALWREIARRYKDEPFIAGYDLLNEPVVAGDAAAWERLARRTAAAIREIDPLHALFVERLNAVMPAGGGSPDWTEDREGRMNFFLLEDDNVVYEFHFYKPFGFTHQNASWLPALRGAEATWPGPYRDWDGSQKQGNRALLERELAPYFAFGRKANVPLLLGEFGVIRQGFAQGRNGAGWTSDVIDLAQAEGVSLTYHVFHEEAFGLYASPPFVLPAPAQRNAALWEVFARKFGGR